MKKEKSDLRKFDNKISKKILYMLAIIIDFFVLVALISAVKEIKYSNSGLNTEYVIYSVIYSVILILLSNLLFRKLISKKGRVSYNVMRRFCSYEEFEQLVTEEKFKQIIFRGIDKVYESKNWLIIGGIFVPKNYIVAAYIMKGVKDIYSVNFILIDGSYLYYSATSINNGLEEIKLILRKCLKQMVVFNSVDDTSTKVSNELKLRYQKYKNTNDYVRFIQKWNQEFDVSNFIKKLQ